MSQASHQFGLQERIPVTRVPGIIVLSASLLEIFGMLHHPTVHASEISDAVEQIARLATRSAVVHGSLIALVLLVAYGFIDFCVRRGLHRPLIRAGALGYAVGVLVMIGAAMASGFIITGLCALVPHATPVDLDINRQLLMLCRVLNQSCANFAVVAMSVGIVCWSLDLCQERGLRRAVGIFGCLVGFAPALALILGAIHLDVAGMTLVVAVQAASNVAVAILMIRRGPLGAKP